MSLRISKPVRLIILLCLAVWADGPQAGAQTPAQLAIQTYAGRSITGTVGTIYQIQYATDLTQTNNASAWRCLEYLQLPASPYPRRSSAAFCSPLNSRLP